MIQAASAASILCLAVTWCTAQMQAARPPSTIGELAQIVAQKRAVARVIDQASTAFATAALAMDAFIPNSPTKLVATVRPLDFYGENLDRLEADLYYLRRRVNTAGVVPAMSLFDAERHRNAMPGLNQPERFFTGRWLNDLGPVNLPVPRQGRSTPTRATYQGRSPISGRINGAAFETGTPNRLYVATASGGVWRSDNGGTDWIPLSNGAEWIGQQTSCVVVDPGNPGRIYVGTGDFDDSHGISPTGFGIMRSDDQGDHWAAPLGNDNMRGFPVRSLLVDPSNSNVIIATTGRLAGHAGQLWRSADGGATWSSPIGATADWTDVVAGIEDSASHTQYIYAAGHSVYGGELWRSSDHGANWTPLEDPFKSPDNFGYQASLSIATSPVDAKTVYVLSGTERRIYRNTNSGDGAWDDITSSAFPNGPLDTNKIPYNWSSPSYTFHIASTRKRGATLDSLLVALVDVVVSDNAGAKWSSLGHTYDENPPNVALAETHNDQHRIVVNPANSEEALLCNDGGVYRISLDPTSHSWRLDSLNRGLSITQFNRIAVDPGHPEQVIGGTRDTGTPVRLTGGQWTNVGGGDGNTPAIDPSDAAVQYATAYSPTGFPAIYKTGFAWEIGRDIAYIDHRQDQTDSFAFVAPLAVDPVSPKNLITAGSVLWTGKPNSIGAYDWSYDSQSLARYGSVTAMAFSLAGTRRLVTVSDDGDVWTKTWPSGTWKPLHKNAPFRRRTITDVNIDPGHSERILISCGGVGAGHVWSCDDVAVPGLPAWTDISGPRDASGQPLPQALPDIAINCIARLPADPGNAFIVGSDIGLFFTADRGATWHDITSSLGLPKVQINDLKTTGRGGWLIAATYGRGIWRIRLP